MRSLLCSSIALLILLGNTYLARAHGYLVRAIPEDRVVVERSPTRLQYWFSEALETEFSSLTVRNVQGSIVAQGRVSSQDDSLLTATLPGSLPDGAYVVDMRLAFASDGHVIAESRVFFVGQEVPGVVSGGVSNRVIPLEVVWRAITLAGTILLFGLLTIYSGILVPAWGNTVYRAGLLPPRVIQRLIIFAILALVVVFLGNFLGLLQQSMSFFNMDAGPVVSQNLWSVVRTATRFGELWTARMLLLFLVSLLIGMSLYFRTEHPEIFRPFWVASCWVVALVIGTFSAGSHAAGSLLWPWVGIFLDWLHALAVGIWAGGLGALALILPVALSPYSGDRRRQAMLAVLRRFSRVVVRCVIIVITTGIYSALNWIVSPNDVSQTAYGGGLILKGVLVVALLMLGFAHHAALRPERFRWWQEMLSHVQEFIPTLRVEAVLALTVLAGAGLLSATPVPIPEYVNTPVSQQSAMTMIDDFSISHSISPGGPGVNTYDTLVTRGGQPADDLSIKIRLVNPARDWRGPWENAERAQDGLYVVTGAEIDQEGRWWTLIDIQTPDGTFKRAAFDWQITGEVTVIQSRSPTIVNGLALAAVIGSVVWAIYPQIRRFYRQLSPSPMTITIVLSAILATGFLVALSFVYLQITQEQYELTISPPPKLINTILPDADSLERGRLLYQSSCAEWKGYNLTQLIRRLPRERDEDLFTLTSAGGQGLPACERSIDDTARWDLVNYIRSLEDGNTRGT